MTPDLRGKPKTGKTTGGGDYREVHYHDTKYTLGNGDYNGDLIEAYIFKGWYLSLRLYIYIYIL